MAENGIRIVGLNEFRSALRRAHGAYPKDLAAGLKAAGEPILRRAAADTPRRSGALASGWSTSVRGTRAEIISRVPYAGGAVWGSRGKWSGFAKYGSPPRFPGKAIETEAEQVARIIELHLRNLIEIEGWARGW